MGHVTPRDLQVLRDSFSIVRLVIFDSLSMLVFGQRDGTIRLVKERRENEYYKKNKITVRSLVYTRKQ